MGIRMTQFIGLPAIAQKFIEDNAVVETTSRCPNCQQELSHSPKRWQYSKTYGMFDDEIALNEYELTNGKKIREVLQASPWSSGPVIFLKLVDENEIDLYAWTEEEMEAYL